MDTARDRTLAEQKSETAKPQNIEQLSQDVHENILSFLDDKKVGARKFKLARQSYRDKYGKTCTPTFFGNLNVLFVELAAKIAHNLLWHLNVEETLELARQHPNSLFTVVKIKDPYDQWVMGTPLQIVAAARDFNTKKRGADEKDYELVERLRTCFPKDSDEYDKQLKKWFGSGSKEATKKTMGPYISAIETLCKDIIESKEILEDRPFEELLKLPIVEKFRKALAPDAKNVVTSGFLFDIQIFLDFFAIWKDNINDKVQDKARPNLGGRYSLKSNLFFAIAYPTLQARSQRCDIGIFKKGVRYVTNTRQQFPRRLDFSNGTPADLIDFGNSFFFDYYGTKRRSDSWCRYIFPEPDQQQTYERLFFGFEILCSSKTSAVELCTTPAQSQTGPSICVMM